MISGHDDPELRLPEGKESSAVDVLLQHLEMEYDLLLKRLTAALRSPEMAADALHDVYLKLGHRPAIGAVRHPFAYLHRMAMNLARNRLRRDALFTSADMAQINVVEDEAPGPDRTVAAKSALALAHKALSTLPAQRREIFLARWRDENSLADIGKAFGLHPRTVQKELRRAERFLRAALKT
jgi:RNA polymerase sigma-70 factor (ECF subfamily)